MESLSIGMFDSGIGGLTVLKEVKRLLPNEHIIYIGDTARVPYGNKSSQTITNYALECAIFLLMKGIKLLVVACNTSSALALTTLKRRLPVPVIGVIEPAAREAAMLTKRKKVGVIGTRATIKSMAYERSIKRLDKEITVISRPCPLFVPIVEEGFEGDRIAYLAAKRYLADLKRSGIDTLVLGCTHYPILEDTIKRVTGRWITLINTGRVTAMEVKRVIHKKGLANPSGKGGCEYFVTDSPETFQDIGSRFLGEDIERIRFLKSLDYKEFIAP